MNFPLNFFHFNPTPIMNLKYIALILFFFATKLFSQNQITITANFEGIKSGTVQTMILHSSGLKDVLKDDKIKFREGKFQILMNLPDKKSPIPLYFFIFDSEKPYMKTDIAILSPHNQSITIKKDGSFIFENSFLTEQKKYYDDFFKDYQNDFAEFNEKGRKLEKPTKIEIDEMIAARDKLVLLKDSLLLTFSKINKDSYFLLNDLSENISTYGFKEIYERTFANFSQKVKHSLWAKNVFSELMISKNFTYGNAFPIVKIDKIQLSELYGKKYTLVDFWFSYCLPCIAEMPFYREIYGRYKENGLEILSISTDRSKDLSNWKNQIEKNKMNWIQLLDENGVESRKNNIIKFPTNFLLDEHGKIVKRDISKVELLTILSQISD